MMIINVGEACDPLSFISHKSVAATTGRKLAVKLKEVSYMRVHGPEPRYNCLFDDKVLTRQQFEIVLQARIGSKVRLIIFLHCTYILPLIYLIGSGKRENSPI